VRLTELHHLVHEVMRVAQALRCQAGGPARPSGRVEAQGEAARTPSSPPPPRGQVKKEASSLSQEGADAGPSRKPFVFQHLLPVVVVLSKQFANYILECNVFLLSFSMRTTG